MISQIPLDGAVDFIRGITFKPVDLVEPLSDDSVVCMRTKNIQHDLDQTDLIAVPPSFIRQERKFLQEGDILLSSANSWELVGKCCYVPKLPYRATAGGFISIVRPKTEVDSRYLYHWLTSPSIQHKLRHCGRQTTNISNLDVSRFKELEFPKTDLEEQRRIAAILDKADAILRKREQALALADDFLRSLFLDMFGDPLANSKNLPTAPIKEFGKVITGNTPPRKNPENYGAGIEWIKSDNINTPDHYLTDAEEHLSEVGMKIGRIVPAGSTLVTCIAGSPSVIGNAALANREVAFNQQINAVVPNTDINPFFLYTQFLVGKTLIQANSTNSMKGMVSKGKFQEIHFLKPDLRQQNEFGRLFEHYLKSREKLQDVSSASQKLFGSLAQRAFGGEL